ncbi:unnamed protein product [Amoebophrya sp. A25]|nr:unnamed protein product [Amoebophrya sp. A25]|eukprot:GSA25T00019217001.1
MEVEQSVAGLQPALSVEGVIQLTDSEADEVIDSPTKKQKGGGDKLSLDIPDFPDMEEEMKKAEERNKKVTAAVMSKKAAKPTNVSMSNPKNEA